MSGTGTPLAPGSLAALVGFDCVAVRTEQLVTTSRIGQDAAKIGCSRRVAGYVLRAATVDVINLEGSPVSEATSDATPTQLLKNAPAQLIVILL